MTTFSEKQPDDWQFVYVVADDPDFVESGYYHNNGHHTYPHGIYILPGDLYSDIQGFTGEAEWSPVPFQDKQ